MMNKAILRLTLTVNLFALLIVSVAAQSGATRPRRVNPATADATANTNVNSTNTTTAAASANTANAFKLLQAGRNAEAFAQADSITKSEPDNAEAWKIAGFAQFNLKRYGEATVALERALELQRAPTNGGVEDPNTLRALAEAYVRGEEFAKALPLLVKIMDTANASNSKPNAPPDASLIYLRGIAEYRTGRTDEAETSFKRTVQRDPKNVGALFYLGQIAFDRGDLNASIAALNRATQGDARSGAAWSLLTISYLRRASEAEAKGVPNTSTADYLSAVRASESLIRVDKTESAVRLNAQALISAKQYTRAAQVLEAFMATKKPEDVQGTTLYLLGVAHSRTKNFPKAIARLEQAASRAPDDASIYSELGYANEITRQYARALAAYEKGLKLAPNDASFSESVTRVKPLVK